MKKIIFFCLCLFCFSPSAEGTHKLGSGPVRTLSGEQCPPWERIECWRDECRFIGEEKFVPTTEHLKKSIFGKGIYEAFGTTTPLSQNFLLHYAKGWNSSKHSTPLLLVHGASSDATRSYGSFYFGGKKGLMFRLQKEGFSVFAITFPCGQGNLYYQAEHIANAIAIIKKRTGAKKVHIICHSAGGVSTRMYLTSVRQKWGTRYRGDVDKVIFVATPHKGIDFIFRHPIAFLRFYAYGMPCPWDWYNAMGDMSDKNVFCGAYPMQLQLLYDMTKEYPLKTTEPDWYTTFHGGKGYVSRCKGLKEAIRIGGNHMARVRSARFPRKIEVYLVGGTKKLLKYHSLQGRIEEEEGEYHGESDGICFLKSAMDLPGLKNRGARIKGYKVYPLNHVELLFYKEPVEWMIQCLREGTKADKKTTDSKKKAS